MNKWLIALGVLLVAQLTLAAVMQLNNNPYAAYEPQAQLLNFQISQMNRLVISTAEARLVFKRQDNQWILPEHDGVTTKPDQVENLLNTLGQLQKGLPIANTSGAARRFKVTDEAFERKLAFYQNDTLLDKLLIGTASGISASHIKKPDEDAIYRAQLGAWQLSTKPEDWLEPPSEEVAPKEEATATEQVQP